MFNLGAAIEQRQKRIDQMNQEIIEHLNNSQFLK